MGFLTSDCVVCKKTQYVSQKTHHTPPRGEQTFMNLFSKKVRRSNAADSAQIPLHSVPILKLLPPIILHSEKILNQKISRSAASIPDLRPGSVDEDGGGITQN